MSNTAATVAQILSDAGIERVFGLPGGDCSANSGPAGNLKRSGCRTGCRACHTKLKPYRIDFQPIDSVKVAEACGVAGIRTSDPDELAAAVTQALERNSSLVAEVPVAYTDYRQLF